MISIEIPTMGEKTLNKVLESIRAQTSQDYEVIVLDSSAGFVASDIAIKYGAKVIKKRCGLLAARESLHELARGDGTLLLDSTRRLERDAIKTLGRSEHDMEIIAEREVGRGMLARAIDLDRAIAFDSIRMDMIEAYALPRYFRSWLLTESFRALRKELGSDFEKITGEDHKMIFIEARRLSGSIGLISDRLILHEGDDNVRSIFSKAMRYARSARIAARHYPQVRARRARKMSGLNVLDIAGLLLLYAVQLAGYYAGYLQGEPS
ncbi:MAG: glycosyltransferase family 2 protein [Nitrososphaerota archaeon]|jgi:glycosyltransferase involved in cell wall biosynthesis|nr:glycosyltransferase family 2 protein [Nitrososphaerota archaeon]MDG6930846.1 glycosyltransferase family 2 protein [Nitrososphaerota archaeon]